MSVGGANSHHIDGAETVGAGETDLAPDAGEIQGRNRAQRRAIDHAVDLLAPASIEQRQGDEPAAVVVQPGEHGPERAAVAPVQRRQDDPRGAAGEHGAEIPPGTGVEQRDAAPGGAEGEERGELLNPADVHFHRLQGVAIAEQPWCLKEGVAEHAHTLQASAKPSEAPPGQHESDQIDGNWVGERAHQSSPICRALSSVEAIATSSQQPSEVFAQDSSCRRRAPRCCSCYSVSVSLAVVGVEAASDDQRRTIAERTAIPGESRHTTHPVPSPSTPWSPPTQAAAHRAPAPLRALYAFRGRDVAHGTACLTAHR